MRHRVRALAHRVIEHAARHAPTGHGYATLAAISVLATWSLTIAVGPFLMAFCAAARTRWRAFTLIATLATALAAVALVRALDVGFAPWIAAQAPELMQSVAWARLQGWIEQWGLAAMLLWLALPLPQVPFVLLAALLHVPSWAIFVAFVFGKGLKYAVEAYAAATGAQAVSTLWRRWLT